MKGKQLAILLGLVAVLGGTGWYLTRNNNTVSSQGGAKVIALPENDDNVARITIQSQDGTVTLVKSENTWIVDERAGYPANFDSIGTLARKIWNLKAVQEVKVGASQLGRLELVEPGKGTPSGTKVEFIGKDGKSLGALLLGKRHTKQADGPMAGMGLGDFPVGRYVMPISAGAKVSLVSDTLEEADAKPASWLKRDFVKVENATSVTLEGATPEKKWKLTQDAGSSEWKLDGAKPEEKLDAEKSASMGASFSNVSIVDVLMPDAKPEDTGLDKPSVLTVVTSDGFTYVFKIGKHNGENFPVKVEVNAKIAKERTPGKDEKPEDKKKLDDEHAADVKRLEEKLVAEKKFESRGYFIAKATIDGVLKDRAELMEDKKETPAPGGPGAGFPGGGFPGGAGLPPGHPAVPGSMPPRPPVSATTPPVTVPPDAVKEAMKEALKKATSEPAKPATPTAPAAPGKPQPAPATEPAKPAAPAESKPAPDAPKPEPTKPAPKE